MIEKLNSDYFFCRCWKTSNFEGTKYTTEASLKSKLEAHTTPGFYQTNSLAHREIITDLIHTDLHWTVLFSPFWRGAQVCRVKNWTEKWQFSKQKNNTNKHHDMMWHRRQGELWK